jgi:ribose 5-phosphate isomerase A
MTTGSSTPIDPGPSDRLGREKKLAAVAAAALVEDGMVVGLGTGSTVAFLLPALAERGLTLTCVATSKKTEADARNLGLHVEPFGDIEHFDIAIDGADQITPEGWLIKGGGAAHTREKIVSATTDRFVIIADSTKPVAALRSPVPVELLEFGLASTLHRLDPVRLRDVPRSPDGGVIADYLGSLEDVAAAAAFLSATAGLVEHGLFPPDLVSDIIVATGDRVDHRSVR